MSPRASPTASDGSGISVGRPRTRPRASVNAALVTGLGAVALRGPSTAERRRAWRTRPRWSSASIQLMYWRPLPTRPPSPSRNGGSMGLSAPPAGVSTMPVRRVTTRIPAAAAGSVARSQALQVRARKVSPDELSSVSTSSPRAP